MYDVAVIGAGPVGLSFALALAGHGLSAVLVERQPEAALREPGFDGRDGAARVPLAGSVPRDTPSRGASAAGD